MNNVRVPIWVFLSILLAVSSPSLADSDSKEIQALKKEVSALKTEVAKLHQSVVTLQAIRPTLTTLMPDFAERFHVMHYAGDAGDWAVAGHELAEMKRMLHIVDVVDPAKAQLLKGFMTESFSKLTAAIEHGNRESFDKALIGTLNNCNACHAAVGSGFIKVTLDVDESLSMRHPHRLTKSKKPGAHMHKH